MTTNVYKITKIRRDRVGTYYMAIEELNKYSQSPNDSTKRNMNNSVNEFLSSQWH